MATDIDLFSSRGVDWSMSRSGNCWDNAIMESIFSSLKTERIGKKVYRSRTQAKADVFDYIESFYNPSSRQHLREPSRSRQCRSRDLATARRSYRQFPRSRGLRRHRRQVAARSGEALPVPRNPGLPCRTALHRTGGIAARWLYFLTGHASTAMIWAGLVLFTEKRARRGVSALHHMTGQITIAAAAGNIIACAAHLHGQQLLSSDIEDRRSMATSIYFLIWLLSLIHAGARPWQEYR